MHLPTNKAEIIVPMPIPFNSPKKIKDNIQAITIKVISKLYQSRFLLYQILFVAFSKQ